MEAFASPDKMPLARQDLVLVIENAKMVAGNSHKFNFINQRNKGHCEKEFAKLSITTKTQDCWPKPAERTFA